MNIKDIKVGHIARNEATGNILLVCKDKVATVVHSTSPYWIGTVYDFDVLQDEYVDLGPIKVDFSDKYVM